MNEIIVSNADMINSQTLLQMVNEARKQCGEKAIRNNDFILKVEDELDGDDGYEKSVTVPPGGGTPMTVITMTYKQAMRVAARESKAVRRSLIDQLEELQQKALAAPQQPVALPSLEASLMLVKAVGADLNMPPSAKLLLYENVCKEYNLPTSLLPGYTTDGEASARLTKSLKDILKEGNVGISAQKANTYLVEEGILEVKTRQSSRGVKKFKALTELGLKFGKNVISPHNPNEVQPHYYEDMAEELIEIIKSKHAIKQLTEVENE